MPLPLIAVLSSSARIALPIIQAGVKAGLSSRSINTAIKSAFGRGIKRQTLLDIIRAEKGIDRAGALLKFMGRNSFPNPLRMPPAITRIRRNFAFIVRVTARITDTDTIIDQNITVSSDTIMSRAQIEQEAENAITDNQERYGLDVESTVIIRAVKAGDQGTLSNPVFV